MRSSGRVWIRFSFLKEFEIMLFQVRSKRVFEAIQFWDTLESLEELGKFLPSPLVVDYTDPDKPILILPVFLYEAEVAQVGDWILKSGENCYCAIESDIFEEYYERIEK